MTRLVARQVSWPLLFLLASGFTSCAIVVRALSSSQPKKPIQRVAIIGSGIAGLSVAHALVNSEALQQKYCTSTSSSPITDVSIFDSRPNDETAQGAGIQLNGGLAVLGDINPDLQRKVWQASLPLTKIQSRGQSWFQEPKNFSTLLQLDLKKMVQEAGEEISEQLMVPIQGNSDNNKKELLFVAILRSTLQKVLLDNLPKPYQVQFDKKMTRIIQNPEGVSCEFADGSVAGPFDLVVGCDGIRSAVKEYVHTGKNNNDDIVSKEPSDAIYAGLRIRFAISDGENAAQEEQPSSSTFTQYFGDGAYALHAIYGAGQNQPVSRGAYIIYLDDNYIGPIRIKDPVDKAVTGENADWSQEATLETTRQNMLEQLDRTGIPDRDNDLGSTIASADRIFDLGTYFHNPFARWSREVKESDAYVVLCGDAAHAFPPFLGQGANQAIQDAYCLVEKIYEYNGQVARGAAEAEEANLKTGLEDYKKIRWPATFDIFWKSVFLGYLETGGSEGLYSKFRDTFFRTLGLAGVPERVLLKAAKPTIK
jgi:salicylate hydroxylase